MTMLLQPEKLTNPLTYFDIRLGNEYVGRMVMELRADVVPRSAENFRALCTGEMGIGQFGKPLHYKGTRFHRIQRVFMAQGGDVVHNDGSSGESIYGPIFEDENFNLPHTEGVVSMANFGKPNSNNSQFFITSVDCSHLNGTNVVVGRILRGFGILNEMEQHCTDDGSVTKDIFIEDCGQLNPNDDWGFGDKDETEDVLPPFPQDWCDINNNYTIQKILQILMGIRHSGNYFFFNRNYIDAYRKYKKAQRYYNYFMNKISDKQSFSQLEKFFVINCVNMAAAQLHLGEYKAAVYSCSEAIKLDANTSKAYFRRGQAEIHLKNYENAIEDLMIAHKLVPDNESVLSEFNRAKQLLMEYRTSQKHALKNLFKSN